MEEPFRSIRFGRFFLFQGLNFSVGYGRSKSRLRDMRRGVEDIFFRAAGTVSRRAEGSVLALS